MNLHGTVRGAITSVNRDTKMPWQASAGRSTNSAGKQVPAYAAPVDVYGQVQPLPMGELKKMDFLQSQGIHRRVYFYGQKQAINRVGAKGGDLLQFPEVPGGTVRTWLIAAVPEQWPDWCCVVCTLQLDPNNPA